MLRYLLYIAIASVTLGIGFISPYILSPHIDDVKVIRQQPEVEGFDEVLYGKEGHDVTVTGFLDAKAKCMNITKSNQEICTTALIGGSDEHKNALVRLRVCSDQLKRNCIAESIPGQDPRRSWVYVFDDDSNAIDIDGSKIIEGTNTWSWNPVPKLRLTGTISIVDGQACFLDPITRVEVAQ